MASPKSVPKSARWGATPKVLWKLTDRTKGFTRRGIRFWGMVWSIFRFKRLFEVFYWCSIVCTLVKWRDIVCSVNWASISSLIFTFGVFVTLFRSAHWPRHLRSPAWAEMRASSWVRWIEHISREFQARASACRFRYGLGGCNLSAAKWFLWLHQAPCWCALSETKIERSKYIWSSSNNQELSVRFSSSDRSVGMYFCFQKQR